MSEELNFGCEFLLLDSQVKGAIKECEGKHIQQVAYSSYHDALTQICFGCKKIRTSLKKDEDVEMNKKDHLDKIFTKQITIEDYKELENQINEYRKLYANAVLVKEKQFIEIMKEREDLLNLIIKLKRRISELKEEDLR